MLDLDERIIDLGEPETVKDKLARIEQKIDVLSEAHFDIKISLAALRQIEMNNQVNIERFWSKQWPEVLHKIEQNAKKIGKIEVSIAELKAKVMVWGGCLTVLVPVLAFLLQNFKIG